MCFDRLNYSEVLANCELESRPCPLERIDVAVMIYFGFADDL